MYPQFISPLCLTSPAGEFLQPFWCLPAEPIPGAELYGVTLLHKAVNKVFRETHLSLDRLEALQRFNRQKNPKNKIKLQGKFQPPAHPVRVV